VITVGDARQRILSRLSPLPSEPVPLLDAAQRVVAETIVAEQPVPPFTNSAMDGFAVRSADIAAAAENPVSLRVIGEVRAGQSSTEQVQPGTAVRIMTGSPIPPGADTVVRVEDTSEADGEVQIRVAATPGTSLRAAGSDVQPGSVVATPGQVITPGLLGVIASTGRTTVRCFRRARVLLLTTGDELQEPGHPLRPGEIVNTNRYSLSAALGGMGAVVRDGGVARDELSELRARLDEARHCDLVVTTGGVSMGAYDLVRRLLESQDAVDFWEVAVRPGKPLTFGTIHGTPLIGLPGNPVSALVGCELFVRPAVYALHGRTDLEPARRGAITDETLESPPHLEQYFRGIAQTQDGALHVRLTGDQGSHVLRSMATANCLVVVPQGAGRVPAGAAVDILELGPIS
jgi:molybdopterin molybdotransferase